MKILIIEEKWRFILFLKLARKRFTVFRALQSLWDILTLLLRNEKYIGRQIFQNTLKNEE